MADLVYFINNLIQVFFDQLPFLLTLVGIAWGVYFINALMGHRLNVLGIIPRHPVGLLGIFLSPFLHADLKHLMSNSLMFFVLSSLMILNGHRVFVQVSIIIVLLSGSAVWLFGRSSIHIGASGVIMGYWGYLLVNAYHQPSIVNIFVAAICLYYFGGLVINLFYAGKAVSWEGHVFGFLSGIIASFLYPIVFAANTG